MKAENRVIGWDDSGTRCAFCGKKTEFGASIRNNGGLLTIRACALSCSGAARHYMRYIALDEPVPAELVH